MTLDRLSPVSRAAQGSLKCSDLGLHIGRMNPGARNDITDVAGVRVGHCTVDDPARGVHTGVTAVLPNDDRLWRSPVRAAFHVINGYGKATGLLEVGELGRLETPILLTNTFSIGAVHEGMVRYALREDAGLGKGRVTLNPVVAECNDSRLSNIQALAVRPEHAIAAVDAAQARPTLQGSVGAGRGMVTFDFKGGIGTASRLVSGRTVGVLVLANLGRRDELVIAGRTAGKMLPHGDDVLASAPSAGSIIAVVATDLPIDERTLARALRRVQTGLARTGANVAHASGEIAIGFCCDAESRELGRPDGLSEPELDQLFDATIEATEEAVLNALFNAEALPDSDLTPIPAFPLARMAELLEA